MLGGPEFLALLFAGVMIVLLSVYAIWWIVSPLASFVEVAEAIGRAPEGDAVVVEKGPREVVQLAKALNAMQGRIRTLVQERTNMLAAISHDLRTPLARLFLYAERLPPSPERRGIADNLTKINEMLTDTLTFLRRGGANEAPQDIDLPSLLQTIASEFADTGYDVSYEGSDRLACRCMPRLLSRAVTNIVENATHYGTVVSIGLRDKGETCEIDVADNGPGIPAALREAVLSPFYRGDDSRAARDRGGFGLGLAIAADITRVHGGHIALLDNVTKGLRVRLTLPRDCETALGPKIA